MKLLFTIFLIVSSCYWNHAIAQPLRFSDGTEKQVFRHGGFAPEGFFDSLVTESNPKNSAVSRNKVVPVSVEYKELIGALDNMSKSTTPFYEASAKTILLWYQPRLKKALDLANTSFGFYQGDHLHTFTADPKLKDPKTDFDQCNLSRTCLHKFRITLVTFKNVSNQTYTIGYLTAITPLPKN